MTSASLRVPIGIDERGAAVAIDLTAHSLVAGVTGSGKSSIMFSVLAEAYRRPNVRVCGADPSAITLSPFVRSSGWIALGTESVEESLAVMRRVVTEMDKRTAALGIAGTDLIPLEWLDGETPLLLTVLEEYAALQRAASKSQLTELEQLVARIAAEGRKARIALLIAIQRPEARLLDGVRSQLAQVISMAQRDLASIRMASETLAADPIASKRVLELKPGQGVVVGEAITFFKGYYLNYPSFRAAVNRSLEAAATHTLSSSP
ncbi:FtsK/SpoIIIE domain-containing protein [Gordonia sp. DT218]|uniref:FtsK/SpoIIIE domain-containing protein n=1 Tax=Gordonia sp. DT218 TaxID=3416659 RepID=UPI003CE6F949